MKQKLLSVILLVFSPIVVSAYVGETFTAKSGDLDMSFTVLDEGATNCVKVGGNWGTCIDWDYDGAVSVPSYVNYNETKYTVTEIGEYAFSSCAMRTISLPSTIVTLRPSAIAYCHNLESIRIPASVMQIYEGAIAQNGIKTIEIESGNVNYCVENNVLYNKAKTVLLQYPCEDKRTYFVIPSTVTRIADYAFDNCDNLVEVTIPNSVKEIGKWAFHQCSLLANMFIPSSVTEIGEGAFTGYNYALTSIKVADDNPVYTAIDGVIYTKDMSTIIAYPVYNSRTEYAILSGTENVYGDSFTGSHNLYSIIIPKSVTQIGTCAFYGCDNLVMVDIPSSVTEIGSQAFDYCTNLSKVYFHSLIPPSVTWSIFGGNEDLKVFVPYQSIGAYKSNPYFYVAHIDPALDWHDNHWSWVFCCVEGIDFSKTEGLTAYKMVKKVKTRSSSESSVEFVEIDKAGPGDCVLLVAEPGKTYELYADETAANLTDNLLVGSVEGTSVSSTDGSMTNYVFNGEEFVQVATAEGIAAGTGFLQIPTSEVSEVGNTISVAEVVEPISSCQITISSYGKKTFSCDKDLDFSCFGDKLKAYVATGYEPRGSNGMSGIIWMTRVKDVPAGTGIFLKGEPGEYSIPISRSTSCYKNMLVGTGNNKTTIPSSTEEHINMYLTLPTGKSELAFCTIAGTEHEMSANAAYLQIPKTFTQRAASSTVEKETISISNYGKSTYCSANDLDFSGMTELKAYVAAGYSNNSSTIWMTRVYDVPAGTGIFLKGAKGNYEVPVVTYSSESMYQSVYENMMVGTLTETTIHSTTETYKNMYLTVDGDALKFCGIAGETRTIGANKAYLQIPLSVLAMARGSEVYNFDYSFNDDVLGVPVMLLGDDTTAIYTIGNAQLDGVWYNLNGQRVENPGKGIFIKNGKKYLIK